MSKGITYFCTDADGNVYSRYSVRHTAPIYGRAVIRREQGKPVPGKNYISYTGRPVSTHGPSQDGVMWGTKAPRTVEVVAVRAYPGRHAVEPGDEVVSVRLVGLR